MGSDVSPQRGLMEEAESVEGPWWRKIWSKLSYLPNRIRSTTAVHRENSDGEDSDAVVVVHRNKWGSSRFVIAIYRLIPFIGYHHVMMFLILVSWLLLSILVAGSSPYAASPLANVYILSVSYVPNTGSVEPGGQNENITSIFSTAAQKGHLTVRTGYFGLCAKSSDDPSWTCRKTSDEIATAMGEKLQDPLDIVGISAHFQERAVSPGLILAAMAISILVLCGLVSVPGWHEEEDDDLESNVGVKSFTSRQLLQAVLVASAFSAILLLISALWQNVSAAAAGVTISYTTYGTTKAHVGPASMVLLWLAFLVLTLVSVGLLVMVLSINALDNLFSLHDDEDNSDVEVEDDIEDTDDSDEDNNDVEVEDDIEDGDEGDEERPLTT